MAKGRSRSKPSLMSYAKPAFGVGLGMFGALIFYMFLAVVFFVSGFVLLKKEKAKPKDKQSDVMKGVAYVLMAFGMIFGLGFGGGIFFSELGGEF
jgi:uncharacterized oligopeptide transporter (OPT) family protein